MFPRQPMLASIADQLDRLGWAVTLTDADCNLAWLSSEMYRLLGDEAKDYLGRHLVELSLSPLIQKISSEGSVLRAGLDLLPALIQDTPGGKERMRELLAAILGDDAAAVVDRVPQTQLPVWTSSMMFAPADGMEQVPTKWVGARICDQDGTFLGLSMMFMSAVPFRLASMLSRGDEDSLERLARLTKPGRRQAVVLFADLEASVVLSHSLPSAIYFRLIQRLTMAIDQAIVDAGGIVGRHAGDGVTAFFVVDDFDSASAACRATIAAARAIISATRNVGKELEERTNGLVVQSNTVYNIGLHWGGSLYMGQLGTGGRLEVTALGDAVNECARIQDSARGGQVLISKGLIENLTPSDAEGAGVDPDALRYRAIAEVPGASEKAIRDAGGIPVALLQL